MCDGADMDLTEMERGLIKRIPGYMDMRTTILDTVFESIPGPRIWLDTGCGTGGLVHDALPRFPGCQFILADPSDENITVSKEVMHGEQRCLYVCKPTDELNFGESTLDVITAVLSHHYYHTQEEKKTALDNCFRMLKKGGMYVAVEHVRSEDQQEKDAEWRSFMSSQGLPEPFIESMISRRFTEYFPLTKCAHIDLLKLCGFNSVSIFWESCSDIGVVAFK